jgi:hypothetical protein
MPKLTRWSIKAALAYLVAGAALAMLGDARAVAPDGVAWPVVRGPLVVHLLVVGWLTQLIFGVAYWMFPTYSAKRPYRSQSLGWFVFVALNLGLLLRVALETGLVAKVLAAVALAGSGAWMQWLFVLSALLQLLAGIAFVVNTWGRVRPHPGAGARGSGGEGR